jgi:RNA polymerase subunit RPABC4/transcription elongation factor Spt4
MKIPKRRKCLMCGKMFTEEMLMCPECDAKSMAKQKKVRKTRKKK